MFLCNAIPSREGKANAYILLLARPCSEAPEDVKGINRALSKSSSFQMSKCFRATNTSAGIHSPKVCALFEPSRYLLFAKATRHMLTAFKPPELANSPSSVPFQQEPHRKWENPYYLTSIAQALKHLKTEAFILSNKKNPFKKINYTLYSPLQK